MTSILTLPNYVLHKTFLNLDLKSVQSISRTCKKFNKIVSTDYFFKQYAPTVNTEKVSCKFLEKFAPHLSMKQIVDWNFNRTPEQMKSVVDKIENNETQRIFFMLTYSLNSYEKFVEKLLPEQMNQNQKKYFYLLKPWQHRTAAIQEYSMVGSIKHNVESQTKWNSEKATYIENLNKILIKENNSKDGIPSFIYLMVGCIRYLRIEASSDLSSFYTELFRRYDLTIHHPNSGDYQLYPIELFNGFCNMKSKHIQSMQELSFFNTHLTKFNESFKDTIVNKLEIVLLYNINKSTLEDFIKLIQNKDHFHEVSVIFNQPWFEDAKETFESAKRVFEGGFTHIKAWRVITI